MSQRIRSSLERTKESPEQRALFERALNQLSIFVESEKLWRPKCFISYARDSRAEPWRDSTVDHWVARFEKDLRYAGFYVFPVRDAQLSPSIVECIATCDRILVVGTPMYLKLHENQVTAPGSAFASEMEMIFRRISGSEVEKSSVMPLLLIGNERFSLPTFLRHCLSTDFRVESRYFATAFDLAVRLYGIGVEHPGLVEIRRSLFQTCIGEELSNLSEAEQPEFSNEQLNAALTRIGKEARQEAFDAGRPVIILKNDKPTWVYPDGSERPADSRNGTPVSED
jgi:hypothetical protein